MIYCSGWLALVLISLTVSLIAFVWGARNGQFADQARARYLPLRDAPGHPPADGQGRPSAGQAREGGSPAGHPGRMPPAFLMLLGIAACSLLIFLTPVVLAFWNRMGE